MSAWLQITFAGETLKAPTFLSRVFSASSWRTGQGFIGYWISPYIGIVLTEHFVFRRGAWARYEPDEAWDKPRHPNLAKGYAALFTFVTSIGLIVLCISQEWWTGPVARAGTGDIAMIVSFVYAVLMYSAARAVEKRRASPRQE